MIHKSINYRRITTLQSSIEHITLELNNDLWISGGYAPPRLLRTANDIEVFFPQNKRAILIGDLNAKHSTWLNHRNNTAGITLFNYLLNNLNIHIHHPDQHTHYPSTITSRPSTIDIALTKGINDVNLHTKTTLCSDHLPIFLEWKNFHPNRDQQSVYSYKNLNWTAFRQKLNDITTIPGPITNIAELETQVHTLTNNIQKTRDQFARKITIKPKIDTLPPDILQKINLRNRYKRAWQRRPTELDRQRIKLLNNEIERSIRNYKTYTWMKYISSLETQDNSLWKLTRNLKRPSTQQTDLIVNGRSLYKDSDKIEAFADYFADVFDDAIVNTQEQQNITNATDAFSSHKYPIPPAILNKLMTTPNEIIKTIKNLPNNKAPGPDTIPNLILKNLPRKVIVHLLQIINAMLTLQHFPMLWKQAHIILFPKPGKNPQELKSYRPISLLSGLGKVAEKLILKRLTKITDSLNIIPDEQFGFRPQRNTVLAVARVVQDAITSFNSLENTSMLLLDIEKAFDKVWHKGLIYKLFALQNIPLYMTSLIQSYLTDRTFAIKRHNKLSNTKSIKAGVPQGTVISPTLFNLYIADFPKTQETKTIMYADDTAIYTNDFQANNTKDKLERHLNIITPYLQTWKIKLNTAKTEIITFTRKRTNTQIDPPLTIDNIQIPTKPQVKYLGIILDKTLRGHAQVTQTLRKAYTVESKLAPIMRPRSFLSPANQLHIYKTIIRPTLLYGAPAWNYISKTQKQRLQVYQNKIIKRALALPMDTRTTYIHELADINTIEEFFDDISNKFFTKTLQGPTITRDLTAIRYQPRTHITHPPIHHKLPIYYEPHRPP